MPKRVEKSRNEADPEAEPQTEPLLPFNERLRYRPDVAARYLGQSRTTTFADIKAGRLRVIREGKNVFVPGSEIVRRSTLPDAPV